MSDVFNWRLPPAPGYPGYQPPPQAPQPRPATQPPTQTGYHQPVGPIQPPPTSVDAGAGGGGGGPDDGGEPYEPYIPSRADRPYSQWGTPDFALQGAINAPGMARGPLMPQMRDIAGLIHAATIGLGRFGSRYTGMPAIAMGTYASAYWNAYQKGMHQRASESYQQYRMARQMTIDRGKEEMKDYATIYATYFKDGKITDEEGFKNDLLQAATKYQNQSLINAIRSGNLGAAERILQMTDSHVMNLIKGQHQEERAKLEDEERRLRIEKLKQGDELPPEWRDPPSSTSGAGGGDDTTPPTPPDDDTVPPDDTTPPTPPDSTAPTPPKATTTTGQAPESTTRTPVPPTATPAINPLIKESADNLVRGEKPLEGTPKAALPRIAAEAERQKSALDNLINNRGITGTDENKDLAAIRKVNPSLARDVDAIGHYKRLVPSGGERMYANMENLVRAVYPHWDAKKYDWIKDFSKSESPDQKELRRSYTLAGAAQAVFRGLADIDENARPPANWIDAATGAVTGSGKWPFLGQAVYDYIVESLTIQNGGTRPLASQIKQEMDRFSITRGAKSIRALMVATAIPTSHRIDAEREIWESQTHLKEPPPGYDEEKSAWMHVIANLDYNTGFPRDNSVPVPKSMEPYLGPAGKNLKGAANMPRIKSPEEAARLPSGTKFIMPDGRIGTVP